MAEEIKKLKFRKLISIERYLRSKTDKDFMLVKIMGGDWITPIVIIARKDKLYTTCFSTTLHNGIEPEEVEEALEFINNPNPPKEFLHDCDHND